MNTKKISDGIWYLLLAGALVLPFIPGGIENTFHGHVLTMVFLYASMAQAWNIISGYCGQTSFGHAVFFGRVGHQHLAATAHSRETFGSTLAAARPVPACVQDKQCHPGSYSL